MQFKLENSVTELSLVREDDKKIFLYSIDGFNPRTKFIDRTDRDGVVQTSDMRVDQRSITFTYTYNNVTESSFINFIDEINAIFLPERAPFYLVDTENNRRIQVYLTSHAMNFKDGTEMKIGTGKINLKTASPFFESTTTNTSGEILNSGDTLVINNNCNFNVFPTITVTNGSAINCDIFRLTNSSNPGNFIEITNGSFSPASEFEIDSKEGKLYLNSILSNFSISRGGLIYLVPGENNIELISTASPLTVSFVWVHKQSF